MRKAIFNVHIKPVGMPELLSKTYDRSLALKGAYASKIGADFIVKTDKTLTCTGWQSPERMEMYDYFDKYDRILYLDADVLVKPNAPDIFKVFDDDDLHMLNESPNPQEDDTYNTNVAYMEQTVFPSMQKNKPDFTPVKWTPYYNAGIMLIPKRYRSIVQYRPNEYFEDYRFEQDYFNYNIWKEQIKVKSLPIEWNAMYIFLKDKTNYVAKNHFIHYVGIERTTLLLDARNL